MRLFVAFVLACLLVGCEQQQPRQGGFQLPTKVLRLNGVKIVVEVADSPDVMQRGLMFRDQLPEGTGMIFIYDEPRQMSFWMKNTRIPLSIGFFSKEGVLLEIRDLKPLDETAIRSASSAVKYAIEVPLGWFERNKIPVGARLEGL